MGIRGPLKLADYVKSVNTTQPKPSAIPKPPNWLSPAGKREWRRVMPGLQEMGLLQNLDRQVLGQYCQCVARIEESELALVDGKFYENNGRQFLRPEYRILQDAQKEVRALAVLLGLAPSARMRMQLPEPKEIDELETLLD